MSFFEWAVAFFAGAGAGMGLSSVVWFRMLKHNRRSAEEGYVLAHRAEHDLIKAFLREARPELLVRIGRELGGNLGELVAAHGVSRGAPRGDS